MVQIRSKASTKYCIALLVFSIEIRAAVTALANLCQLLAMFKNQFVIFYEASSANRKVCIRIRISSRPMNRINQITQISFHVQRTFVWVFVSIWTRAWLPYLPNSLWIQCGRSLEARPLQLKHVFMLNFVETLQPNNCLCTCISGAHFQLTYKLQLVLALHDSITICLFFTKHLLTLKYLKGSLHFPKCMSTKNFKRPLSPYPRQDQDFQSRDFPGRDAPSLLEFPPRKFIDFGKQSLCSLFSCKNIICCWCKTDIVWGVVVALVDNLFFT